MTIILSTILLLLFLGIFISKIVDASESKKNLYFGLIAFLILFFLSGFRNPNLYNDTPMYVDYYKSLKSIGFIKLDLNHRFELGFQLLSQLIFNFISSSPLIFLIITSAIIQFSNILFFKKYSKILWFSIFLYIGFTYYFFSVSAIRQALAISVFNLALYFLINKKFIYYYVLIVFASQFHTSSLILLFFPAIYLVKINWYFIIGYIISTLFIYLFLEDLLQFFFHNFSNYGVNYIDQNWISKSKLGTSLIIITIIIGFFFIIKSMDVFNLDNTNKIMFFSYLLLISFWLFSLKISVLSRYTQYFMPASIVLLSNAIAAYSVKLRNYSMYFWIVFLILQLLVILNYRPEWFNVTPYLFYWQ